MQFHQILLELDLCQILASYKQFLRCYSQNSRPMPKKAKKRTQISIPTSQLLGNCIGYFNLQHRDYTITKYQPVLGSICSVIPKIVGKCPKQGKSALKCQSKCLNYSQSAPIALYIDTRATYIPMFSQIYTISVVLLAKCPPTPKIHKKRTYNTNPSTSICVRAAP